MTHRETEEIMENYMNKLFKSDWLLNDCVLN